MKKQYAFYFDSSNCSGCKTCQAACKDKNNLDVGILWRRVYEVSSGKWENRNGAWVNNIKAYNVSMACNHCEIPVCANVCPTKSMTKNKHGIVTVDKERCIGCNYCAWACPYGAPQYDEKNGVMTKCNLCIDYVEDGKNPSCVDSCPMRVLDFGELKKLEKKYGDNSEVFPLPENDVTDPAIIIKPHNNSSSSGNSEAKIINKEEI